ncbi:hypothetical protein LX70_02642 [Defluviimonas denitrificans]|jgi:hypothetical protein|uniref:Uncharacterized protein n=1 Tax=Albidovulum denitrificans TaxID=404881 RepID=A0A2S8S6F5_9RHOB|nr:hypothetical protein [Defluviimonas denitrificans]PQV56376.1 hypothetical protein LX70_02642 [Defluviimonas denitrificans]
MSRLTIPELTERAARGVGKVDRDGLRGATLVSADEVEAMALLLAILGVKPVYPGSYPPPNKIPHTEGERA